jgi:hypothetical protein
MLKLIARGALTRESGFCVAGCLPARVTTFVFSDVINCIFYHLGWQPPHPPPHAAEAAVLNILISDWGWGIRYVHRSHIWQNRKIVPSNAPSKRDVSVDPPVIYWKEEKFNLWKIYVKQIWQNLLSLFWPSVLNLTCFVWVSINICSPLKGPKHEIFGFGFFT